MIEIDHMKELHKPEQLPTTHIQLSHPSTHDSLRERFFQRLANSTNQMTHTVASTPCNIEQLHFIPQDEVFCLSSRRYKNLRNWRTTLK
jgi:hypothetical protein